MLLLTASFGWYQTQAHWQDNRNIFFTWTQRLKCKNLNVNIWTWLLSSFTMKWAKHQTLFLLLWLYNMKSWWSPLWLVNMIVSDMLKTSKSTNIQQMHSKTKTLQDVKYIHRWNFLNISLLVLTCKGDFSMSKQWSKYTPFQEINTTQYLWWFV